MSTKSKENPKAERPNEDCFCNMLRNATDDRCTCNQKIDNDCPIFVQYKCSNCGCHCKLRCNICQTCFPHNEHKKQIDSHCYDCSMWLNETEGDYYDGW